MSKIFEAITTASALYPTSPEYILVLPEIVASPFITIRPVKCKFRFKDLEGLTSDEVIWNIDPNFTAIGTCRPSFYYQFTAFDEEVKLTQLQFNFNYVDYDIWSYNNYNYGFEFPYMRIYRPKFIIFTQDVYNVAVGPPDDITINFDGVNFGKDFENVIPSKRRYLLPIKWSFDGSTESSLYEIQTPTQLSIKIPKTLLTTAGGKTITFTYTPPGTTFGKYYTVT
jgi:hypothetical protein